VGEERVLRPHSVLESTGSEVSWRGLEGQGEDWMESNGLSETHNAWAEVRSIVGLFKHLPLIHLQVFGSSSICSNALAKIIGGLVNPSWARHHPSGTLECHQKGVNHDIGFH